MQIMKKVLQLTILCLTALSFQAVAQQGFIFPKGEKGANVHHVGDVWLSHVSNADSIFKYNIAEATFAPGARLDWHIHPGGQQLLITDGVGYYQERNKPLETVHKGEVVKCQPGVEHWHGATPDTWFTYVAVTGGPPTKWLERVTDEAYFGNKKSSASSLTNEQEIIELSRQKWQWMADKDVAKLADLFDAKAKFVHMGGSWGTEQELNIIKSGGIWYKKADIHEVSVEIIGNTAILLNRITLLAVVGGNEVTNPFQVTEVYVRNDGKWKLGSLSFTKLLTPEDAKH
jgi:quercetin dioxygenase-like cupin family protein